MPANTEKVLSSVYAIRAMLETDKPAAVAAALDALTDDLTDQMRRDAAAQAGRGNAEKIIRGVLRRADAVRNGGENSPIKYQWTDAEGYQCVCDGAMMIRLADALPLPPRPASASKPLNTAQFFRKDVTTDDAFDFLPLPDPADVRAFIRADRARLSAVPAGRQRKEARTSGKYFIWDFGKGRPCVNAMYLLEIMTIFPDAKRIYFRRGRAGLASALQVVASNGDAVILPVRLEKNARMQREADADELAKNLTPDEFAALVG